MYAGTGATFCVARLTTIIVTDEPATPATIGAICVVSTMPRNSQPNATDDPAIIETAHELLRLDNLREDWYRALMRAYARQGKREAALAQFVQCRQVLQAELGVEPITETVALAEAIRQGRFEPLRPDLSSHRHRPRYV